VELSTASHFFTQIWALRGFQRGVIHRRSRTKRDALKKLTTARNILEFGTIDGADANSLGKKVGALTPVKRADVILLRTHNINTLPFNSALGIDTATIATLLRARRDSLKVAFRSNE
jgi:cytosine/adenosine deaminase-related metal-dependent hydrolase